MYKRQATTGGLRQLSGNLGRGVIKVSAVAPERQIIEAPCRIFHDQNDVKAAFKANEITTDTVIVVRFQGPQANGMPELHSLTPMLTVLQDRGLRMALVTDGRMSGASGKVPAAIHVSPEAARGGPLARLRNGDVAVSYTHLDVYKRQALYLGVCDKIVPGLIMAAAAFGHIPAVFVPAGPMTSGLPNDEKAKVRNAFAQGQVCLLYTSRCV